MNKWQYVIAYIILIVAILSASSVLIAGTGNNSPPNITVEILPGITYG